MKTMGQKIYELRRKNGMSQEQLGFEVGVARQTISKWEADTMQPTTDNFKTLCDFFNVTAEYFLGDDSPTDTKTKKESGVCSETSTTPPEVTTTVATDTAEKSTTEIVATKCYSKKKIAVLTLLTSISVVVFVASIIIGAIAIDIASMPALGYNEEHGLSADLFAIICGALAIAALSAVITLLVLLKRNKKHKM